VESVATWLNNVFPFMIGVHFGRPINVVVVIAVMGGLDDRVCLLIESRLRDEPASCIFESSEDWTHRAVFSVIHIGYAFCLRGITRFSRHFSWRFALGSRVWRIAGSLSSNTTWSAEESRKKCGQPYCSMNYFG